MALGFAQYVFGAGIVVAPESLNPRQIGEMEKRSSIL
jgi:hypothetical protein